MNPSLGLRSEKFRKAKTLMTGFLFLGVSGFLAWGAQQASYSAALKDWERKRLPSEKVWIHALGSRGWGVPPTSPSMAKATRAALRRLPAMLDSAGSVWMSRDSEWVVVFGSPEAVVPQTVFCRNCKEPPAAWEPVGVGWPGFDQAMARIDERAEKTKSAPEPRKTARYRDFRQLQF